MLYYNQVSKKEEQYALNFNGTNQCLISQTTAQGGLNFVQWDKNQPWTFFAEFTPITLGDYRYIYSTRDINKNHGIILFFLNSYLVVWMRGSGSLDTIYLIQKFFYLGNNLENLHITYDGSGNSNGFRVYMGGIEIIGFDTAGTSTLGSIITDNRFTIGGDISDTSTYFKGIIKHLSFVNYVKSPDELTEDYNNKKQSVGTGSWLLAPIEPIYKDDGSKQIKTLDTISINNPLPNANAFVNEQGYKLNLINYPTTLVKGIDLIKL